MTNLRGLIAYPSEPGQIGNVIEEARNTLEKFPSTEDLVPWEELDIAGRFIGTDVLKEIENGNIFIADITELNFNVVFEVGFSIGSEKPTILIKNDTLEISENLIRKVGIFDTIGYESYSNSTELRNYISSIEDPTPIRMTVSDLNKGAPIYRLQPRDKNDSEIKLSSHLEKARLKTRIFDPEEHGRLPAGDAIDNVAQSLGVITILQPEIRKDSRVHNFRSAFVAGLTKALGKPLLLLQEGDDPVPIDYRDLVKSFEDNNKIKDYIAEFSPKITSRLQSEKSVQIKEPKSFLEKLTLGASSAENEIDKLSQYYLETDEYQRASRGEVRIVTGRKGSGKSALFFQLRDRIRSDQDLIVLDLKPEGFQLLKLRDRVLQYLEKGTREHTVTAFWEYLLLLEICRKLIEIDEERHLRNQDLYEPYQELKDIYDNYDYMSEGGGFSERMLMLTNRIIEDFEDIHEDDIHKKEKESPILTSGEITELLYEHNISELQESVIDYLSFKDGLWILFDNLDKGWPAHGLNEEDVTSLRALIDAMRKIEQRVNKQGVNCDGMIFIRNDVYELLVGSSSDRGKVTQAALDWTDPDLLRELLRRRIIYNSDIDQDTDFEDLWREIAVSHINGEESSQYIIDRCLMRPRALIEFVNYCRSHAVNLGHEQIEIEDIKEGEENYSNQMLNNINFEIHDVFGNGRDILYEFIECPVDINEKELMNIGNRVVEEKQLDTLIELLQWFGFIGIVRENNEATYIYDVKYDIKRLKAIGNNRKEDGKLIYRINPAFWKALEVKN